MASKKNVAVKAVVKEVVANSVNSAAISTKLTNAIAIREYWSANEELKSNMKLYDILSRCYELYAEYMTAKDKRQWKADFYDAISNINDNFKKYEVENKLTLTIVRVVFGDSDLCRKRVSIYAKVLRIAGDNGGDSRIKVADLAAWITERGGVQEISKTKEALAKEATDKVTYVQKRLRSLATVEKIDQVKSIDLVGNYMLLLVSVEDSALLVKHVFKETDFVNSAIKKLYSEYKSKEVVQQKLSEVEVSDAIASIESNIDLAKLAA